MIYVLETGEYSDYEFHAIVEAPDDIDFGSMFDEVMVEAKAMQIERYKEYAKSPTGDWAQRSLDSGEVHVGAEDTIAAWVRALERRGGKELRYTAVHIGSKWGSLTSPPEVKELPPRGT